MVPILADAQADTAQALAAMSAMIGTFLIIGLAFLAFTIWLFWRIFTKAGFNGALALLNLIPSFGFLICILILAFGTWPNEMQQQHAGMPPGGGPHGGPPMTT
ncbi:MAG: hypothetical protein KGN02_06060 [bacterium]|nr:hypothetical protein [bacterium]